MTARRKIGDMALLRIPRHPNAVDIRIRDDTVDLSVMIVEYQRRDYLPEGGEPLHVCGDRHDDVNGSADAGQQQDTAQNI